MVNSWGATNLINEDAHVNAFLSPSLENYCLVCFKKSTKPTERQNQLEILASSLFTTFIAPLEITEVDDHNDTPHPPATPTPSKTRNTAMDSSTNSPFSESSSKTGRASASKAKKTESDSISVDMAGPTEAPQKEKSKKTVTKVSTEDGKKVRSLILDPSRDKDVVTEERSRVQQGRMELQRVMSLFESEGLQIGDSNNKALTVFMREIEEFLNKSKMTREEVTSKGDDVFDFIRCINEEGDRQGGLDLYTGWSKEEFLTVMDAMYGTSNEEQPVGGTGATGSIPGGGVVSTEYQHWFRKKDNRLFYEVDHIWEVQIMHIAIRELMRFRAAKPKSEMKMTDKQIISISNFLYKYQIGLVELHYITKLLNSLSNLNCTPWNINLYKGKLMKQFRSTYQINETALNYDLRSYLIGNRNYGFLMKSFPFYKHIWKNNVDDGLAAKSRPIITGSNAEVESSAEDIDGNVLAASKHSIYQNIQNAMRNVLTTVFYQQFFAFDSSTATASDIGMEGGDDVDMMNRMMLNRDVLKLLYGILCHMYQTMFPDC